MAVSKDIGTCIAGAALFGLSYGAGGNVFSVSSEVLPRAHRGTAQILTLYGAIAGESNFFLLLEHFDEGSRFLISGFSPQVSSWVSTLELS